MEWTLYRFFKPARCHIAAIGRLRVGRRALNPSPGHSSVRRNFRKCLSKRSCSSSLI